LPEGTTIDDELFLYYSIMHFALLLVLSEIEFGEQLTFFVLLVMQSQRNDFINT